MADIARWITAQDMPTENNTGELAPLIKTLRASDDWEQRELGRFAEVALLGLWRKEQRSISPVYSTAANIVWPWVDSGVAASASSCEIDLEPFMWPPASVPATLVTTYHFGLRPELALN